jgi:hypothetical protein
MREWSTGGIIIVRGESKNLVKACSGITSSTTNPYGLPWE